MVIGAALLSKSSQRRGPDIHRTVVSIPSPRTILTYTHSANILSVLEITPTQLYLVSRDNFLFPLPTPLCIHSLGSPPQCLTQCTCSWSQGHTGLSVEQPETRSQSQTPNYPQQSNIAHYAIMHQIRSGDETTQNQPMGRDQLYKILWSAKLEVYM